MSGKSFAAGMGVGTFTGLLVGTTLGIVMGVYTRTKRESASEENFQESMKNAEDWINEIRKDVEEDEEKLKTASSAEN